MKIINEEKLKPVITSKQVMIENKPITNVIYDDDGDWLCFHAYTIKEDDAYIVSIEQIIEHDKTLLSLPDLREEEKVRRSNINELWEKY